MIPAKTQAGAQAYQILDWVYGDPAGRAREGMRRAGLLARQVTGRELDEVRDAGGMIARLAPPDGQAIGLAAWQHEARDSHGRWTGGDAGVAALSPVYNEIPETRGVSRTKGTYAGDGGTGRDREDQERMRAFYGSQAAPITAAEARGNSRPVSAREFAELAGEGWERLRAIQGAPWNTDGMQARWPQVKNRAYAEVRKPWGGATIDPRTGDDLPQGADKYAMSVKPSGMDTTTVPETASRAEFSQAMDVALAKYGRQLAKGGSYLGVFHDDELHRIDIDPVTVLDSQQEVETIGAYTHAIGGAYHFATGNGFWPPHVAEGVHMSNQDTHWAGPGQWHSYAIAVQPPHDEPEDQPGITGQALAGDMDSITGQAMELAAWQHEARNTHGEWTRGGSITSQARGSRVSTQRHVRMYGEGRLRSAQRSRQQAEAARFADKVAEQTSQEAEAQQRRDAQAQQLMVDTAVAAAQSRIQAAEHTREIDAKRAADMHRMLSAVRSANQRVSDLQHQESERHALTKAAVELSVVIAGAVLAGVMALIGVPAMLAITAAALPPVIQVLTEWKKRV